MAEYLKIPLLPSISSWRDVNIIECGEKLCLIDESISEKIVIEPKYFLQGIEGSIKECYVRETVFKKLIEASRLLPDGYKFVIFDAWRPIEVQQALFHRYKEMFKLQNPNMSENELLNLTQKYVSLPSMDEKSPAPHNTGGAVDLSIVDQSGNYLDMGTNYDEFSEITYTRYFEEKIENGENLSKTEFNILNNRRLLFHILTSIGFTNYPEEWWHFDYGNQFWGKCKGVDAVYGMVRLGDRN